MQPNRQQTIFRRQIVTAHGSYHRQNVVVQKTLEPLFSGKLSNKCVNRRKGSLQLILCDLFARIRDRSWYQKAIRNVVRDM
jgi:hypothetical protein